MKFNFFRAIASTVLAVAVMSTGAMAGSSTGTLTVTSSVAKKCTVSSPTLPFGAYDPVVANLTANLDSSTTITMTCTKGASGITLGFGASANDPAGCTAPARCMKDAGTDYMNYQLYSDSSGGTVWTTAIAETVTGGITTPTTVTVYGRVPGAQDVAVGSYSDSVTATINY